VSTARGTGSVAEAGCERVTLNEPDWRWWYFVSQGGFTFARGGRATTEQECHRLIDDAYRVAVCELAEYRYRPTHMLSIPDGSLIPLPSGDIPVALPRPR